MDNLRRYFIESNFDELKFVTKYGLLPRKYLLDNKMYMNNTSANYLWYTDDKFKNFAFSYCIAIKNEKPVGIALINHEYNLETKKEIENFKYDDNRAFFGYFSIYIIPEERNNKYSQIITYKLKNLVDRIKYPILNNLKDPKLLCLFCSNRAYPILRGIFHSKKYLINVDDSMSGVEFKKKKDFLIK